MSLLIDTDVLIDYLRDQPEAVSYLESLTEQILISAITVAELCPPHIDSKQPRLQSPQRVNRFFRRERFDIEIAQFVNHGIIGGFKQ